MASTLGAANPLTYRGYVYDDESSLYYLQSRYYNPEVGRFINADTLVSTGKGLLGNNMFAYCNNNSTNSCDPRGTIPSYDYPMQQTIEEFCRWYWETDENEKNKEGNTTIGAQIKKTINSVVHNFEITAGAGVGAGKELVLLGVGISLHANYDIVSLQCGDDSLSCGQRIAMNVSTALTQAFEFGGGLDIFSHYTGGVDSTAWIIYNNTQETWTLFSFSDYSLFIGGNLTITFDLNTFLAEVTDIWQNGR